MVRYLTTLHFVATTLANHPGQTVCRPFSLGVSPSNLLRSSRHRIARAKSNPGKNFPSVKKESDRHTLEVNDTTHVMSVYAWGKNSSGELGVGNTEDRLDPVTIEGMRGNVIDIASGEKHCLAVNEFGDVFAWGRGKDGQHGIGRKEKFSTTPIHVSTLDPYRIAKVICGSNHCVAVNRQGEVFQWGMLHRFDNKKANFGPEIQLPGMHGKPKKQEESIQEWEQKRNDMVERSIRQYYSGKTNSEIADKESVDYNSEVSNFGSFSAHLQTTPTMLESLENVKIVDGAAGYAFTLVIIR